MNLSQQTIVADIAQGAAVRTIGARNPVFRETDPEYHDDNRAIAARLKKQDPKILDQLILRYEHRLMRHLLYLTGDRELAEDLFQETWMRVLERGSQFRGDSQFVTWLFTIARNLVFDLKRRTPSLRSFEEMTEIGDERCFHARGGERAAFDHCAAREKERLLAKALPVLTALQREVFMLRFRQEMPLQEIAIVTGAPLSTVKARLYRALATLNSHLARARGTNPEARGASRAGQREHREPTFAPQWRSA